MRFEWDDRKNKHNLGKHDLAFEDAADILRDLRKIVYESAQSGNDLARYIAIGKLKGKHYAVIYTLRGHVVRIISARRARDAEKREYRAVFGE